MFDFLCLFIKIIFLANLSILMLLYFPARFCMACYLRLKSKDFEKLNDFSPHVYYSLGLSLVFLANGLFSSASVDTPLYVLLELGVLGLLLEVNRRNISFIKRNLTFLKYFCVIFLICFGQYVFHSLGYDEYIYFEYLSSYDKGNWLPAVGVAGYKIPRYGLFIPLLYVMSLVSFPLMAFSVVLVQSLLLAIIFMAIIGRAENFNKLDVLIVLLLAVHIFGGESLIGNMVAANTAYLMVVVSLLVLASDFSKDSMVQFFILLLTLYSVLIHPSAIILCLNVFVMIMLIGRILLRPLALAVVFFMATALVFFGMDSFLQKSVKQNLSPVGVEIAETSEGFNLDEADEVIEQGHLLFSSDAKTNFITLWFQQAVAVYVMAFRSYTIKHGYYRTFSLVVIFIAIVSFRKRFTYD